MRWWRRRRGPCELPTKRKTAWRSAGGGRGLPASAPPHPTARRHPRAAGRGTRQPQAAGGAGGGPGGRGEGGGGREGAGDVGRPGGGFKECDDYVSTLKFLS